MPNRSVPSSLGSVLGAHVRTCLWDVGVSPSGLGWGSLRRECHFHLAFLLRLIANSGPGFIRRIRPSEAGLPVPSLGCARAHVPLRFGCPPLWFGMGLSPSRMPFSSGFSLACYRKIRSAVPCTAPPLPVLNARARPHTHVRRCGCGCLLLWFGFGLSPSRLSFSSSGFSFACHRNIWSVASCAAPPRPVLEAHARAHTD